MTVAVIGAGIAGLTAALKLRQEGSEVTLLTKGVGGLQLSQGTVDVLGYTPERVSHPFDAIANYAEAVPEHPYASIGVENTRAGVEYFTSLLGPDLLSGDGEKNLHLPTAVGAYRPTAVAPPSMHNGSLGDGLRVAIAGPRELKDFHPSFIAKNLNRVDLPAGGRVDAFPVSFSLPARGDESDSSGVMYARRLDTRNYRVAFAAAIAPQVQHADVVGLPAILGLKDALAWQELQNEIGKPIFEIPIAPPGVPGMRFNERLTSLAKAERIRFMMNTPVVGAQTEGDRISGLIYNVAGGQRILPVEAVVYAAGGFESGAIHLDSYGNISETVLGLPLLGTDNEDLVRAGFWDNEKSLFKIGVAVDDAMRVLRGRDVVYSNLVATGGILAGAIRWSDKSGEGIALGSAVRAAQTILEDLR